MNARVNREELAADKKAVVHLLEEIATDANSLQNLFIDMECSDIRLDVSALPVFRVFAEKIGWMAEAGIKRITGFCPIKGDAEDWLLRPAARDAVKAKDEPIEDQSISTDSIRQLLVIADAYTAMNTEQRRALLDFCSSVPKEHQELAKPADNREEA